MDNLLLRDPVMPGPEEAVEKEESEELLLAAPTGILTHLPERAEPGARHVWPEVTGTVKPDYLRPGVLVIAAAGYAWFLLAFWTAFWGYGYMMASMTVATLISGLMLGLIAGFGEGGRNVMPWERPWHSFREFLDGEVAVWGARVPGREAFWQLAVMSWLLAGLATAFAIIIMAVRTT
jgi:hypothetical protein